jgi:hypothetical protein
VLTTTIFPIMRLGPGLVGLVKPGCCAVGWLNLCRSPRRWTSAWMTVRPARVILGVPDMQALRDTLLRASCGTISRWQCRNQRAAGKISRNLIETKIDAPRGFLFEEPRRRACVGGNCMVIAAVCKCPRLYDLAAVTLYQEVTEKNAVPSKHNQRALAMSH